MNYNQTKITETVHKNINIYYCIFGKNNNTSIIAHDCKLTILFYTKNL